MATAALPNIVLIHSGRRSHCCEICERDAKQCEHKLMPQNRNNQTRIRQRGRFRLVSGSNHSCGDTIYSSGEATLLTLTEEGSRDVLR